MRVVPAAAAALGILLQAQEINTLQVSCGLFPLRTILHTPQNPSPSHSSRFAVSFQGKPVSFSPPANFLDKMWTDPSAPATSQPHPVGHGDAEEGVHDASIFGEDPQEAGGALWWKGALTKPGVHAAPGRLVSSFFKATRLLVATVAVWLCIHMLYVSSLTVLAAFSAPSPWRAATWAKALQFARVDLAQGAVGTRLHDLLFHPRMSLTIDVRWIGALLFGPLLGGLFNRRRATSTWPQQVLQQHPEAYEMIGKGENMPPATAWYFEGEGSSYSSSSRFPSPFRSPSPPPPPTTTFPSPQPRLPSPAPDLAPIAAADPTPLVSNHALPWQQSHYSEPAQNNVLYSSSDVGEAQRDMHDDRASIADEPAMTYEAYMAMRAKKEG